MNAPADQNFIRSKLGILNTDGITAIPIKINPLTGGIKVNEIDTISFTMIPIDYRDENYQKVLLMQGTDGLTYPIVVNSSGEILIDP